jgi:hypothetical protein
VNQRINEFKQSTSSCGCAAFAPFVLFRGWPAGFAGIKPDQGGSNQIKPNQTKSNLIEPRQ